MTEHLPITLSLHDEQGVVVDTQRLRDVALRTAAGEGATGEISITLVDADRIAGLNARYLDGDGPTDVLSFPADSLVSSRTGRPGRWRGHSPPRSCRPGPAAPSPRRRAGATRPC